MPHTTQFDAETVVGDELRTLFDEEYSQLDILFARDIGSRARGLAGDDSDYDAFVVFGQDPVRYALGTEVETIDTSVGVDETDLERELDVHGWSLDRYIGADGLGGSNPTALEVASSPVTYVRPATEFGTNVEYIESNGRKMFTPYALINHYRSLAASNYRRYIESGHTLSTGVSYRHILRQSGSIPGEFDLSIQVDEEATQIGDDSIDIVGQFVDRFATTVAIDDIDDDLLTRTTTDRTVSRYVVIVQALLSARYVEQTATVPPLSYVELIEWTRRNTDVPTGIVTDALGLKPMKQIGSDVPYQNPRLDRFIESELDRTVAPDEHTGRAPDTGLLRDEAERIYTEGY